jgi:NAD(P)H dehydrogenase (quinone)
MSHVAHPLIVITGASGQLGRRTAELVLERQHPDRLILVTRDPDALSDLAARGAQVRFGDFDEPESLHEALAGGERMLLISATDLERRVEQHLTAIRAAAAVGVRHVAYTSVVSPEPPNPSAVAPSHRATERALEESGLEWTFLRNSLYAEYQVAEAARSIATGTLVHNRGEGRVAYVSREDCAAVAATVLTAPGHERCVYDVTGPEPFSATDLAVLYGQIGGRTVETVALDDEGFVASLVGDAGGDDHLKYGAELVASFGRAIREGYLASSTDAVASLTQRAPLPLRQLLEAHRSELEIPPGA